MRLSECSAVLTGASGGIGLELASQLCAAGARVLAVSRHMGPLAGLMNRYPSSCVGNRPICAARPGARP